MDVYMQILGFLILIIHRATLLITFPNRFKLRYSIGILIIALLLTNQFRNQTADLIQWKGLSTFLNLFLLCWLLKGSFFQITFAYYFQYILTVVQLYIAEAIVGVFINPASEKFTLFVFIPVMATYTAYVFLMAKYGKRIFQRLLVDGRTSEWVLYSFGAVFSFIVLTVSRDYPNSALLNILFLFFIIWCFIVFCFAIINTHEKYSQKYEADFAREVISSGREHYQKMNEMYDMLGILRHDYKYHMNTIAELTQSGDIDAIKEYLTDIEAQIPENEFRLYCSNSVINALLGSYAERCAKMNIKYSVSLSMPEMLTIPNYEMCIVLGNLLENAVEACVKKECGREIEITIKNQGELLAVLVKNSYNGIMIEADGQPVSEKKDGGFGLRSVKAVAERYGGHILTKWDTDAFSVYVMLKM